MSSKPRQTKLIQVTTARHGDEPIPMPTDLPPYFFEDEDFNLHLTEESLMPEQSKIVPPTLQPSHSQKVLHDFGPNKLIACSE